MLQPVKEINKIIANIPPKFVNSILEYAISIKKRVDNGELSDTEYLNKIPGMSDSIIKESSKDKGEYSDKLDW